MKSQPQLSVNNLLSSCRNAQNESVNSLVIQCNGVNYPLINAQIVPQRNHSDLVLFVGATALEPPKTSFLTSLFTKKPTPQPKKPLEEQLHDALFYAIETVLNDNGKNPHNFDFKTLQIIKKAFATFSEAFETYSSPSKETKNVSKKSDSFGGVL